MVSAAAVTAASHGAVIDHLAGDAERGLARLKDRRELWLEAMSEVILYQAG